jgi:transcriptional regulator with XRE-family HTH domain
MTEGPYPNHLGRFMREKGLTDPALARLLEISKQQIFNLRQGHRKLTVEWAQRIAPHLEVSWQELITGSGASPLDQAGADLLAAFYSMNQRDRETLLRVADRMRREDEPAPEQPTNRRGGAPPHPMLGGGVVKNLGSRFKGPDPPHPSNRGTGQKIKVGARGR